MITNGKHRNDYAISFKKSASAFAGALNDPNEAALTADEMIERYYSDMGQIPDSATLEKLADAILSDKLMDSRAFKTRREEYPFLSESQLKERDSRSFPFDVELLDAVQTGDISAEDYAERSKHQFKKKRPTKWKRPNVYKKHDDARAKWSRTVRDRDGYKCQNPNCNGRNGVMHAHHILNYADFPESRYDVHNGVTLCEQCHIEFHQIYGKERNNGEQITEYFGAQPYKMPEMSVLKV